MSDYKKILYTVFFVSSIVVANVTASKLTYIDLPVIGIVGVTAAFIPFGLALLFSDCLNELFGKKYTQKVVNSTIVSLVFVYLIIWITILLPPAPFYELSSEYKQVLSSSSAVMIASVVTFFFTQHIDIFLFTRFKEEVEAKWFRNIFSTTLSQLGDTILFVSLAFLIIPKIQGMEGMMLLPLLYLIIGEYLMKFIVALSETPLFYLLTWGEDV